MLKQARRDDLTCGYMDRTCVRTTAEEKKVIGEGNIKSNVSGAGLQPHTREPQHSHTATDYHSRRRAATPGSIRASSIAGSGQNHASNHTRSQRSHTDSFAHKNVAVAAHSASMAFPSSKREGSIAVYQELGGARSGKLDNTGRDNHESEVKAKSRRETWTVSNHQPEKRRSFFPDAEAGEVEVIKDKSGSDFLTTGQKQEEDINYNGRFVVVEKHQSFSMMLSITQSMMTDDDSTDSILPGNSFESTKNMDTTTPGNGASHVSYDHKKKLIISGCRDQIIDSSITTPTRTKQKSAQSSTRSDASQGFWTELLDTSWNICNGDMSYFKKELKHLAGTRP
jgi:hypothetical protein